MKITNKKPLIISGSISLLAIISTLLAFNNLNGGYNGSIESQEWMKNLADTADLREISIPGSHDSGALYSIADVAGKCQDISIANQLNVGVRFLDIRLKATNNGFNVIHGIVDERATFNNVLNDCKNFLSAHPSETILMSVKEEESTSINFAEKFEDTIKNDNIWITSTNTLPKLGDARGKIILLSRYKNSTLGLNLYDDWKDGGSSSSHNTFEINLSGDTIFHIQDHYTLADNEDKWVEVVENLEFANNNNDRYIINFLSAYLEKGFPPSYSVPVAKYINPKFLNETSSYTKVGTILFDFVSQDLAKSVYERNF